MNLSHDPGMDEGIIFGIIKERPKQPTRLSQDTIDTIGMKDIHQMGNGKFFTDAKLDGFLGILSCKNRYKIDLANIKFLVSARQKDYNQRFISIVMRSRNQGETIFDLGNYFVLNHTPPLPWGVIHVSSKQKNIVCFDGLHGKGQENFWEVKKCLNILASVLNITEYKTCEWQKKNIDKNLLPKQSDGWNCGTFVVLYAYHITMNGYVAKSLEDENYLMLFRKFMFSCFFETNENNEPTLSTLG